MNELSMVRFRRKTHQVLKDEARIHGYKEWALADRIISEYFENKAR